MARRPTYYRRAVLKPGATKMSPLWGSYVAETRADLGFGSDHHSTFGVRRSIFVVAILSVSPETPACDVTGGLEPSKLQTSGNLVNEQQAA